MSHQPPRSRYDYAQEDPKNEKEVTAPPPRDATAAHISQLRESGINVFASSETWTEEEKEFAANRHKMEGRRCNRCVVLNKKCIVLGAQMQCNSCTDARQACTWKEPERNPKPCDNCKARGKKCTVESAEKDCEWCTSNQKACVRS